MAKKEEPTPGSSPAPKKAEDPKKAEKPAAAKPGGTGHVGHGPGDNLVAPSYTSRTTGYGSVEWLHEHELTVDQTIDLYREILRVAREPSTEPTYRRTIYHLQKFEIEYKQITMSHERDYLINLSIVKKIQSMDMNKLENIKAYSEYRDKTYAALQAWRLSYRILARIHACLHGDAKSNLARKPPDKRDAPK